MTATREGTDAMNDTVEVPREIVGRAIAWIEAARMNNPTAKALNEAAQIIGELQAASPTEDGGGWREALERLALTATQVVSGYATSDDWVALDVALQIANEALFPQPAPRSSDGGV